MGRGRAPPQLFAIGLGFSFLLGLVLLCVGLGFYVPELQKESEYVTLSSCSITSYREQDYDCSYESCGSCRRRLGEGIEAQRKSEGAATVAAAAASPKTEPRRRLDECCHWVEQTCTNYFYGLGYVFPDSVDVHPGKVCTASEPGPLIGAPLIGANTPENILDIVPECEAAAVKARAKGYVVKGGLHREGTNCEYEGRGERVCVLLCVYVCVCVCVCVLLCVYV